MKHPSSHFSRLRENVVKVGRICNRVDPFACKSDVDQLKVQSFIVFAHAAIEEYFEEVVLEAATEARSRYVKENRITRALVGLISASILDEAGERKAAKKAGEDVARSIESFSARSHSKFVSNVRRNNGIKKNDLKNMLLPVGVDPEEVDLVTVNALDAFGTKRGSIAHSRKIVKVHTRGEISADLGNIMRGIKLLDKAICQAIL